MLALGVCLSGCVSSGGGCWLLPATMPEHWPHVSRIDHVEITTDQLVHVYENKFDEMHCKLDSACNTKCI